MNKEYKEKLETLQGMEFCNCLKEYIEHNEQLEQENKELHNKIDKAIEYIKKYQQIYDIDGSIEKQIDEFNILASPKRLLEILKN